MRSSYYPGTLAGVEDRGAAFKANRLLLLLYVRSHNLHYCRLWLGEGHRSHPQGSHCCPNSTLCLQHPVREVCRRGEEELRRGLTVQT